MFRVDELLAARAEINEVDTEMAALFERRMAAVEKVLDYKRAHGLPVLDAGREAEVLRKGALRVHDAALRGYYTQLLQKMMELSRDYQTSRLADFCVGYPGVEGSFSHIAEQRIFGDAPARAYVTFEDVFAAVQRGEVTAGVVPFENSYTGEVGEVLDLLWKYDSCLVVDSYDLDIRQNLLGVPGAELGQVKQVYSHHQAISQCQAYLTGKGYELVPYANTALAAKYVSECGDKTKAAIASADTAALYGLSILARDINTSAQNVTRFIVISRLPRRSGGNRFGLVFTVRHDAGALAQAMQIIGSRNFNLESIRSRSMKELPWQYFFYVEVVGDSETPEAHQMLDQLAAACRQLRLIGSWARREE